MSRRVWAGRPRRSSSPARRPGGPPCPWSRRPRWRTWPHTRPRPVRSGPRVRARQWAGRRPVFPSAVPVPEKGRRPGRPRAARWPRQGAESRARPDRRAAPRRGSARHRAFGTRRPCHMSGAGPRRHRCRTGESTGTRPSTGVVTRRSYPPASHPRAARSAQRAGRPARPGARGRRPPASPGKCRRGRRSGPGPPTRPCRRSRTASTRNSGCATARSMAPTAVASVERHRSNGTTLRVG
ncbi:hypothetical protein SPRI_4895 [Streptomyces pristinaespiralis]|uniref:Uncharacterized protein n=1 Tax=Streptomyces pristinaespiralis TaxID=38300 RepID=A0A0M4DEV7_STRPR|nr:hypothetical protein SPRI_4895 [Streptomyces pristinaespiralis]